MANWNNPTVNSNYVTFVDEVKNRDVDSARMFDGTGDNLPNLTIRWNQSNQRFERLQDGTWSARTLSVGGGGTGASTPSGARSSLELGSMAIQSSNNVSITGGSISGVSLTGGIVSGLSSPLPLSSGGTAATNLSGVASSIGTPANTGNRLVARDGSGNFSAGTITANGSGLTNLNADNLATGTVPDARLGTSTTVSAVSGNFTSGWIYLYKIGRLVILSHSVLQHDEMHTPMSQSGLIPPEYLPATFQRSSNATGAIATNVSTLQSPPSNTVSQIFVTDTGRFYANHKNLDNGLNRSTTVVWSGNMMYEAAS